MELARDPLDYLGLERGIESAIEDLVQLLLDGAYRAMPPEWIRSAKRVGLTRPLAFLAPRDALVYKALVGLAENDLLQGSAPWTRLGRDDPGADEDTDPTLAESGWFRAWLRREGQIWVIDQNHEWIVESDVSNFFPSIQVSDVCAFVQENSRLGIGLVRLLEHMLQTFSPMAAYRPSRVGGLPQEGFDVSRVLAHLYLRPLDEEFRAEGESKKYSRWVDDIVIGADSWDEALRIVSRIQNSLESIGLYANSAKTRIIRTSEFRLEYMKAENDWIGEFEDRLKAGTASRDEFKAKLKEHLAGDRRRRGWPRVLRRFYTNSRRLRDPYLLSHWPGHLDDSPDSIRTVFDYLSSFRLTAQRFALLLETLEHFGSVYEDFEILAHEYLCVAPSINSPALRDRIADWALEIVRRETDSRPRIAAAACITVGKFGSDAHLDELQRIYSRIKRDTVLRTQAAVILTGAGRLRSPDLSKLLVRSRLETIETLEFLLALLDGEPKAVGMVLGALAPVQKGEPQRYVLKPRLLFLAPLVRQASPTRWRTVSAGWRSKLTSNDPALRDHIGEKWVFG